MIEIKKMFPGFFRAYVDGVDSAYTIRLANALGGGSGKAYYDVYKDNQRINDLFIKLNLYKAKQKVIAEILKNS